MLSDSNQYLLHVVVKGLKGEYGPVIEWYKELCANCEALMGILAQEPEGSSALVKILEIFKAGLYSKNTEVAIWACKLLAQMANQLKVGELSGAAWDWFVGDNGGLHGVLHGLKSLHDLPGESVVSLLCQFGRYNFTELFTHHMKLAIQDAGEYMQRVTRLIPALADFKLSRDELGSGGVLVFWIDLGCRRADIDNPNIAERAAALGLLLELWTHFGASIEEKAEYGEHIIRLMQRANRDRNSSLQMLSLALLFRLLENFAHDRNPYAPVVYKTLTFALVENHQKASLREFIFSNFRTVFDTFSSIPISILLDPLIKQASPIHLILT